ncbi:MAG TPA: tRNA lysidine(34) synthetase TilS [Pseudidiomarina sp.]|nr:tRNA lysidine(34) synthetase TilS [Pseudidiomarina sp.]
MRQQDELKQGATTSLPPFRDLYPTLCQSLTKLPPAASRLFVACLGGGADSQTLLDLLDRYRHDHPEGHYLAIHLDHEFHSDSAIWAASLKTDCERRQFPFYGEVIAVAQGPRVSKEAAGRDARYQRLIELATERAEGKQIVMLLGQHRNDQIETFLLQLKRGSGPKGLSAMAPITERGGCWWVRPLLNVSKAEIYAYAVERQLHWVEDNTNYDTLIDRNFLRHDIIPHLEARWPGFGDAVARSAALCAEQQELLEGLLNEQLKANTDSDGHLMCGWLEQQQPAQQRALLRLWIEKSAAAVPSYAVLEQIREQMLYSENDRQPLVRWDRFTITRHNQPRKNRRLQIQQEPL